MYSNNVIVGGLSICTAASDIIKSSKNLESSFQENGNGNKLRGNAGQAIHTFDNIVSGCPESRELKETAKKMAMTDLPILITGESGVGKEIFAQAIHNTSQRRNGPFIPVNCAAIPSELLESEMFGYSDAAFTGAKKGGKIGLFEAANGGTIFLDEFSEMSVYMQAKFLRVLQEKTIRPVGSYADKKIDIRIIAATNRDLPDLIKEGKFRIDIYYRISAFSIELLPLRQRKEDILPLAAMFLAQESRKYHTNLKMSKTVEQALIQYDWPGNVRELQNTIAAAAALSNNNLVDINQFPKHICSRSDTKDTASQLTLQEILREAEVNAIRCALDKYGNTVSGKKSAAKELGISISSLYYKLKKTEL